MTLERLIRVAQTALEGSEADLGHVTAQTRLQEDLGLNSITMLMLMIGIEDEFSIRFPTERLPELNDVKEGIIASKIAAHAADIAKGVKGASEWDRQMGMARKKLDWEKTFELSIDPEKARNYRASAKPEKEDTCSMCGNFCAVKNMNRILDGEIVSIFDE